VTKIYYGVVKSVLGNAPIQICPDCLSKNATELFPAMLSLSGPVEGPKCDYCSSLEEEAAAATTAYAIAYGPPISSEEFQKILDEAPKVDLRTSRPVAEPLKPECTLSKEFGDSRYSQET
jgi:hypothetical protein